MSRSRCVVHGRRARAILQLEEGSTGVEVADRLGLHVRTIYQYHRRYKTDGVHGLFCVWPRGTW